MNYLKQRMQYLFHTRHNQTVDREPHAGFLNR
jgi:hypothetical protein